MVKGDHLGAPYHHAFKDAIVDFLGDVDPDR
jgi:hypothetical protein